LIITINTKEDSHDEIKRAIEVLRSIVESGEGYSNYNDYGSGSSSSTPNYDNYGNNSPNHGNTQPANTAPAVNDGLFNLFNDDPVPTPQSAYPQQQPTNYPQAQPYQQQPNTYPQQPTQYPQQPPAYNEQPTYPSDIGPQQQESPTPFGLFEEEKKDDDDDPQVVPY